MAPREFSNGIIELGRSILKRETTESQAGIISGANPTHFKSSDPLQVWIIQLVIIICITQLLSLILSRLRQPRVIAEVIGGVILGPTIMGRIPNFSQAIFPPDSLPFLNLTATIGLVLFLFLVGLEIDVRVIKRNALSSTIISLTGLILPFGLGAAVAIPIYREFIDPSVEFGHFLLFVGVAIAITAFPVLCRILTELRLLDTTVGVIVLSAGVGNDVVGWVLLALAVALANASAGITALYVLLASTAWTLFMLLPVRWAYLWLARRTGSLENGSPTAFLMVVTLIVVFVSAFMTDILGVHAIFGGFIAGLIVPHENGFDIALVEKMEDLVSLLFLPLYFTLSGLKTNFGYLDNGITWGYTILICVIAFFGKFVGCGAAAKLCGFAWRESATIGMLMSCKGLVELIVLNIGLQAGILNTRVFSMFVLHALVLTVITTPGTIWLYPPHLRIRLGNDGQPIIIEEKGGENGTRESSTDGDEDSDGLKTRFAVVINKIEHLPAMMAITHLLQPASANQPQVLSLVPTTTSAGSTSKPPTSPILPHIPAKMGTGGLGVSSVETRMDVLRLMELSARTSAVMRSSAADELIHRDSLLAIFRTFGHLNKIAVGSSLSVVPFEHFSSSVAKHAQDHSSQMVFLPWTGDFSTESEEHHTPYTPFDGVFGISHPENATSAAASQFIRSVFQHSPTDVAVFVDRGLSHLGAMHGTYGHHIMLPFFGGPDDRLALSFVVQLCLNPGTTATVIRVRRVEDNGGDGVPTAEGRTPVPGNTITSHHSGNAAFPDTIYAHQNSQHRMASETADNLAWARYTSSSIGNSPVIEQALRSVTFTTLDASNPLHSLINMANTEFKRTVEEWKNLIIVLGRARRMAVENHHAELKEIATEYPHHLVGTDMARKTVGDVATSLLLSGVKASLVVVQAAEATEDD